MKIITAQQGSPEWHAHRASHFNASDAPAMMGAGKYTTRSELLHRLATGEVEDVNAATQALFDRGHATEALARPLIEAMIGEELYPAVGVSDEYPRLSASFDGITMDGDTGFEHKLWNEALAESVRTGAIADDPAYFWQLEQQIIVGGLQRVIFTVSDGTEARMETYTYLPRPGRAQQLIAGWSQFLKDLDGYVPPAAKAAVVAAPVETLPAIVCTVNRTNMTVTHNLDEYRAAVDMLAERTKPPMVTDQDFADRKAVCKRLRNGEAALKAEAERLIGQMAEIAATHRGLNDLSEVVRKLAIDGENKVAAEETNRKQAVIDAGARALDVHLATLQANLNGRVTMPAINGNFAAATKNLRTIASFENAVDTELARCKIEANAAAEAIAANLATLDELAADHLFLFRDLQQLVVMPDEAFRATVEGRVATHKAQEAAKLQAERERIASEEREKAEREARARVEAEERARREEEQRLAKLQADQQAPAAPATAPAAQEAPAAPQVTTAPPAKTGGMGAYAKLRARPSANDITNLVATTYQTSPDQAREWLIAAFNTEAQEA